MRAGVTGLVGLLVVSALSLSCGDPQSATPSPEVVATAEAVARTVTFAARYSTTPEKGDEEEDPIVLDARVFGRGRTGVILSHMRPADQSSWFPFATELARTGKFTVLTFNFRGYGDSTGEKQFDRIDTDLEAAVEYMRDTLGVDRIFLVGASMGGTASLVVGARTRVAGVVSISSPGQFPPLDAVETVDEITAPKLFITAEDDVPAFRSQAEFWEAAAEPKIQQVYDGDEHGTALFDGPHGADLRARLLDFLSQAE
jgi:alpha-beta hydrolase superfamily lysophospholipase